ncbi:MAG: helix-turn-helix domain-containing protein [Verrucomicrobia bacterium]|nr:helix-turn-helix domain-containing protein [Verrucomicrobiota bacterium]
MRVHKRRQFRENRFSTTLLVYRRGTAEIIISGAITSPLMTYQEAANYLRISLATIDRMVRAGEISSVLIRGRRLFRIRDLDDYIHSHCIPGGK